MENAGAVRPPAAKGLAHRALRRCRTAVGAVVVAFENPDMRRIQLAWAAMSFALWSFTIALGVYAFDVGGATAVGIAGLVRLLPGALASPFAGLFGDRYSRRLVLQLSTLAGSATLAAATALAALDAPAPCVFALAGLLMVAISPYVPAEGAFLPIIARTPQELAASNVAHAAMDNLGFLGGALVAGALLAAASPAAVFALAAAGALVTLVFLARVRRDQRPAYAAEIELSAAARETAAGFRALTADPGLRVLATALTVLVLFEGAADAIVVVVALELLELGPGSVGYLNAAWGIGALAGSAILAVLLDRGRLAIGLVAGSIVIGAATALPAVWVVPLAAYLAWAGIGVGYTFVEVAARTLMQRLGSDETLARAFGVVETTRLAAMAVGSIAAPALIALFGTRGALVALAAVVPAFAFLRWAALRAFETGTPIAERAYALLRGDAIFAPLPVATVEGLSRVAIAIDFEPGAEIIVQGDDGDRFYVVDRGEVEVRRDGEFRCIEGEGESFGEIALLRDVARTATVRARCATRVWALDRKHFIAAVTGSTRSHEIARGVARGRVPEPLR
jgi:MFS family permease